MFGLRLLPGGSYAAAVRAGLPDADLAALRTLNLASQQERFSWGIAPLPPRPVQQNEELSYGGFTLPLGIASLGGKEFTFKLNEALKKGPAVVYFYPSAYTGGCDLEAHTFAEQSDKFASAGATIIGVSADDLTRLHQFSADPKFCAGKFPIASDADTLFPCGTSVVAVTTVQDVVALVTDQTVIARIAVDGVVAGRATELVRPGPTR